MKQFLLLSLLLCCLFFDVFSLSLNDQVELPTFCSGSNKDNARVLSCCEAVKAFEGSEMSESGGAAAPELKECVLCGTELCPRE
ncbi:hypothetical protein niasHT_026126 [Heterodera trifolii]|uniref:Uncharacterized protein n=1 Tax=Heterodera trifolii TaxID=157864 RepID=A0ABD2KR66_9BILA